MNHFLYVVDKASTHYLSLYNIGSIYYSQREDLEKAYHYFSMCNTENPHDLEAIFSLAITCWDLKKHDQAKLLLHAIADNTAYNKDWIYVNALNALGRFYHIVYHNIPQASFYLHKAAQLSKEKNTILTTFNVHYNLGVLYQKEINLIYAIECFEKSLYILHNDECMQTNPQLNSAKLFYLHTIYTKLADLYEKIGNISKAQEYQLKIKEYASIS
jgi:tetratricopeptide (TPR) repeat protein